MNITVIYLFCLLTSIIRGLTVDYSSLRDESWTLRTVSKTKPDVETRFDCLVLCQVTNGCVGGHWKVADKSCSLMINSVTKRVTYAKKIRAIDDFVFGTPCEASRGYGFYPGTYIKEDNDVRIQPISYPDCIQQCSWRSWCRSADIQFSTHLCYLSASDRLSGALITVHAPSWDDYSHAERLC